MHIVQIHVCVKLGIWQIVQNEGDIDVIAWVAYHRDTDYLATKIVKDSIVALERYRVSRLKSVHVSQDSVVIQQDIKSIKAIYQVRVAVIGVDVISEP